MRLPKGTHNEGCIITNAPNTPNFQKNDYLTRYSILLIDDNETLLDTLQNAFEANFDVLKATDGESGFYFAQNSIPDLVICDINLPKMNGFEVCNALKNDQLTRHIPVLLISGNSNERIESESYSYGAADFIAKPFNVAQLKQKIYSLLNSISINKENSISAVLSKSVALPEAADDIIVKKIITIITQNMENSDYNVDVIAHEIGLSRTQFWRKTKSILGKSPSDLLRDLRLQRAAEMLQSGKYRVSEIAYSVGFTDPRYFSRCFSKNFGQTPTEYFERYK